jgi:hypothetical protein
MMAEHGSLVPDFAKVCSGGGASGFSGSGVDRIMSPPSSRRLGIRTGVSATTCSACHILTALVACMATTTGGPSCRSKISPVPVAKTVGEIIREPNLQMVAVTAAAGPVARSHTDR